MIDLTQKVLVTWNNYTKEWYQSKGYQYTKTRESFYVTANDLMPSSTVKVTVVCDYCGNQKELSYGKYMKTTKNNTEKYACAGKCGRRKIEENRADKIIYYNQFIEFCNINNYTPISQYEDYQSFHSDLKFICPLHGEQIIKLDSIKAGCKCNLCGYESSRKKNMKPKSEVIRIVNQKNNNTLLNPEEYTNTHTKNLKIECGSCNNIFITSLNSVMNSEGACPQCGIRKSAGSNKLSPSIVEKTINSINNNILLNANEYKNNSTRNLKIKCGACGNIFITSLFNYKYFNVNRCSECSSKTSKGEIAVKKVLEDLNISYETEVRFDQCKNIRCLPFDFYLPQYNTCIEFDGQFHYLPLHGEETLRNTQKRDQLKNKFCFENDIKLIRIPYWEGNHIKDILVQELKIA